MQYDNSYGKKDKPSLFIGGSIGLWKKEKTNPVYS